MKYLTALPVFVLLFLLDLAVLALCAAVIGLFIALDNRDYPFSFTFAQKVWLR